MLHTDVCNPWPSGAKLTTVFSCSALILSKIPLCWRAVYSQLLPLHSQFVTCSCKNRDERDCLVRFWHGEQDSDMARVYDLYSMMHATMQLSWHTHALQYQKWSHWNCLSGWLPKAQHTCIHMEAKQYFGLTYALNCLLQNPWSMVVSLLSLYSSTGSNTSIWQSTYSTLYSLILDMGQPLPRMWCLT